VICDDNPFHFFFKEPIDSVSSPIVKCVYNMTLDEFYRSSPGGRAAIPRL